MAGGAPGATRPPALRASGRCGPARQRAVSRRAGGAVAVYYGLSITDAEFVLRDSLRLEHQGVLPDEVVVPTPGDVATGRDPALARALHLAGLEVDPAAAGRLLRRGWRNVDL